MPKPYPPIPTADFQAFVRVVRRLRRDCPWDRKQTHKSLRHALIEETYEVVQALDDGDMRELSKELGDLLLHVVLQATIAEQNGEFLLREVLVQETEKLIRRHPHVFGTTKVKNSEEVKQNWERLKMKEGRTSVLEGIPRYMPALIRALRVQQRAAKVGFDWENEEQVWKKVREELEEVREALRGKKHVKREEEFGDLLFALVNYARFLRINPENALRGTIEKFTSRFHYIEAQLAKKGKTAHDSTLEEMDELWEQAKKKKRLRARRRPA
ncbi:MAG: nucleoside triphosphate pyrophosphohydrolase [Bacteroidetes bacterium]|nr:nucleoside triphosphate pyrophosphohydrolase [Bacteroidota bacterium]